MTELKQLFDEFEQSNNQDIQKDDDINFVISRAENSKGVITVLITLIYKNYRPGSGYNSIK